VLGSSGSLSANQFKIENVQVQAQNLHQEKQ
jgi:hypothetical protein